jgi:hypothetical protein
MTFEQRRSEELLFGYVLSTQIVHQRALLFLLGML